MRSDESWSRSGENSLAGSGWCSLADRELRVSQICLRVLSGSGTKHSSIWLDNCLDDADALSSGTVSASHLVVHLGDGSAKGSVSVLLVHVNNICSRQILEYDTVVLNSVVLALEDLANRYDLTLALSDLLLTFHFIPELRSGNNGVLSEDSNSVASWVWVLLRWILSANNPVLANYLDRKSVV